MGAAKVARVAVGAAVARAAAAAGVFASCNCYFDNHLSSY